MKTTPSTNSKIAFSDYTGKGIKVAVIDSGIDPAHPDVRNVSGGVRIRIDSHNRPVFSDDYFDVIGHGTACAGIIRKKAPNVDLYSVRVFDEDLTTKTSVIIEAIKWAVDNKMDIVNLSLGTSDKALLDELEKACDYAYEHNTILVAAGANNGNGNGCYPANFRNVIGVTGGKIYEKYSYFYKKNGPVEFVARGDRQKLAWLKPPYVFMGGTSFASPHITAIVALILERYPGLNFDQLRHILIEKSTPGRVALVQETPNYSNYLPRLPLSLKFKESREKFAWIKKAVLYPYNKEMHAFIRFRDLLHFEIVAVVDPIGKGLVGKDAGEVIGLPPAGITITHKLEEALTRADTLIIGYLDQISRISKQNILQDTLAKALRLNKNIFSFSVIERKKYADVLSLAREKRLRIYYPIVTSRDYNRLLPFKNLKINKPVIGIFGTSSQQGKFTTQLALRRNLLELGYKVGQIGTEHHSELFGCDAAFPMGYDASMRIPLKSYIPFLILKMTELCKCKNPDIIIVGAQSGIIPFELSEDIMAYLQSIAFLYGTVPDAYILNVNSIDPDEYIQDSINALEALGKGKTILLTMSTLAKDIRTAYGTSRIINRVLSKEEIARKINYLEKTFNVPVTEVISQEGQYKMLNVVINYFAKR